MGEFPLPFGGINQSTWVMRPEEIRRAVAYLTSGCGREHHHNFAVEMDGYRIHTTNLGIQCIRRLQGSVEYSHATGLVFFRKDGEKPRHGLYADEMDALAEYNSARSRGVAHTPEWEGAMAALQDRFDAAREI
jgi:hypothetical protein